MMNKFWKLLSVCTSEANEPNLNSQGSACPPTNVKVGATPTPDEASTGASATVLDPYGKWTTSTVGARAPAGARCLLMSNGSKVVFSTFRPGEERLKCSLAVNNDSSPFLYPLPAFSDLQHASRQNLFVAKLHLCCYNFDFTDPIKNVMEKEIKRQTLLELLEYVKAEKEKFREAVLEDITKMVATNLFRTLPPSSCENARGGDFDPEDDKRPTMDPSWPHLQIVYGFLEYYILSPLVDVKLAKRYINHSFVSRFLDLFESEDTRERDYLTKILHLIYSKFMLHRPFIRKGISNIFYHVIFETQKHNGIAELLEVVGSIIKGLSLPIREEHKIFLKRALIPLHRPDCFSMYHQELSYCITHFVRKDFQLADTMIRGLLKYWPVTNSQKEVLFLEELKEVLEVTQAAEFQRCMVPLFRQIGSCLKSLHFLVAESALLLWNNDQFVGLVAQNRQVVLPLIFTSLERNKSHWRLAVRQLTLVVRHSFFEMDQDLFQQCQQKFQEDESKEKEVKEKREKAWKLLEAAASTDKC